MEEADPLRASLIWCSVGGVLIALPGGYLAVDTAQQFWVTIVCAFVSSAAWAAGAVWPLYSNKPRAPGIANAGAAVAALIAVGSSAAYPPPIKQQLNSWLHQMHLAQTVPDVPSSG
jgi:drug/metabolite transporter (DMT)-like permease